MNKNTESPSCLRSLTPADIEQAAMLCERIADAKARDAQALGILDERADHGVSDLVEGLAFAAYSKAADAPAGSPFKRSYRYRDAAALLRSGQIVRAEAA